MEKSRKTALFKSADALRTAAVVDHASYMGRGTVTLPAGPNATLPMPKRMNLNQKSPDPSLAALYFQYGRHLMVSGSRPDSRSDGEATGLRGRGGFEVDIEWRDGAVTRATIVSHLGGPLVLRHAEKKGTNPRHTSGATGGVDTLKTITPVVSIAASGLKQFLRQERRKIFDGVGLMAVGDE